MSQSYQTSFIIEKPLFIESFIYPKSPLGIIKLTSSSDSKQIVEDSNGKKWMIKCTHKPIYNNFIASAVYKLILGDYTSNDKLIISQENKEVCMGSEFIDNFIEFNKLCVNNFGRTNYACIQNKYEQGINHNLVTATMILMEEKDANTGNIGIIKNDDGSYNIAKIDHDLSEVANAKHLMSAAGGLNSKTSIQIMNFLSNKKGLADALDYIAQLPTSEWETILKARAESFAQTTNTSVDTTIIRAILDKKASAPLYAKSLRIEDVILSKDLNALKELASSHYDLNAKYFYTSKSDFCLPVVIAAQTNDVSIVEYLYNLSPKDSAIKMDILKSAMDHRSGNVIKFILNQDNNSELSNYELINIAISLPYQEMLKILIELNYDISNVKSFTLDQILLSNNILAYDLWNQDKSKNFQKYLDDLTKLSSLYKYSYNKIELPSHIISKLADEVNVFSQAKEAVELITDGYSVKVGDFFENSIYEPAFRKIFSLYLRNDQEITEYIFKQFKRFDVDYATKYVPNYIINLATDKDKVIKGLAEKFSPSIIKSLNRNEVDIYEFFIHNKYIDQIKFTQDVADNLFKHGCPDLLNKGDFYNRFEIYNDECSEIKGKILDKISEVTKKTGVYFDLQQMNQAKTAYFSVERTIEFSDLTKFLGLFTDPNKLKNEVDSSRSQTCAAIKDLETLPQDIVNQCQIQYGQSALYEWDQVNFIISDNDITFRSEQNILTKFFIDLNGEITSQCDII